MGEPSQPFVRRVVLRNYKSIKECDVSLGPLTFLVGPNGSGKSNFLDALRFVAESLSSPMGESVSERGGIDELCHRSQAGLKCLSIELELGLRDGGDASYKLVVRANPPSEFEVEQEYCRVCARGTPAAGYRVRNGEVEQATFEGTPRVVPDRLYLTIASSFPEFRGLYDLLAQMRFYNIDPHEIRTDVPIQDSRGSAPRSHILLPGGGGAREVLRGISHVSAGRRIEEYMHAILPDFERVAVESVLDFARRVNSPVADLIENEGIGESLAFFWFVLRVGNEPVYFPVKSMSDGTLRALGVLLALFQCLGRPAEAPIPLVGIEEPESALHPAAAGVLFDALHEASHFTQVLVTTHSPDLLDIPDLDPDSLLIVDMVEGKSVIGPADDVSRSIMRDRLSTAGELLRQNHLRPQGQSPGPVPAESD
ncbi:MAG TPA: AAA family ATPase [Thermoguttaceae bacterium]|nr:AAA family ATPase [Thermoguttaceae bacterium]